MERNDYAVVETSEGMLLTGENMRGITFFGFSDKGFCAGRF